MAGKSLFTRRALIAGGLPLMFALAVTVVLWWPQSVSIHDLKVKFVRFETSDDGGSEDYAVLEVRNESSRKWMLNGALQWLPLKEKDMFQALGRFAKGPPTGESGRVARNYIGGGSSHTLKTNIPEQVVVLLPRRGEKGWIEIFSWTPPETRRGLVGLVQQLWWRCIRRPTTFWTWVRCEVPIQCGRERSYGKPVPPSVLSQDGKPPAPSP